MSDRYDVAARLAEGRPAVERTRTYVSACQALGYTQPDLTARPSQVDEWFEADAGLDLKALDSDVSELRVALTAVEEALWVQRSQAAELATAWRGSGGDAATGFLRRHCDVAAEVAGHLRAAAEHCATLRDDLWRAVDGKVATTVAIDQRRIAEHPAWLAAAQTVTTGSPGRSAAEALVRGQVMPYVDNDIRQDWLAAMSSANAAVASAYDATIHALAPAGELRFEIPGDLGPTRQTALDERAATAPVMSLPATATPVAPAMTMPASVTDPSPPTPDAAQRFSDAEPNGVDPEPADPIPALDDAGGLSTGAGGLGGLGGMTGGLGGIMGSIADTIAGLLSSLTAGSDGGGLGDDPLHVGTSDDDDAADDDAADDDASPDDIDPPPDATGTAEPVTPAVSAVPPAAVDAVAQPVDPLPATAPPADAPLAPEVAPAAEQPAKGSTPCEIAADQLPQVGQ